MYKIEKIGENVFYIKALGTFPKSVAEQFVKEFKEKIKDLENFSAIIDGLDFILLAMKSFDVIHVKDWVFKSPSLFLTSACLMGRVDGLPPWLNIGMSLLHAGCNAVFVNIRCPSGALSVRVAIKSAIKKSESHYYYDDLLNFWFEEIVKKDASVGIASRNAKNSYSQNLLNLNWWDIYLNINPKEYESEGLDFYNEAVK